ncbi:MAG TPA: hypothetical protein VKP65_02995 [Rhodothermales bacterium]|nr:hypothetical protein [Rhodothermales bacterium]
MTKYYFLTILMVACLVVFTGCGGEEDGTDEAVPEENMAGHEDANENESENDEPESVADAMQQMQEAMSSNGEAVEPVDFRVLRDMLPEDLPGMERTNTEGQKSGAMGIKMSEAQATYQGEDNSRVEITIIDMGTMKSAAMMGYAWLMAEIDRESDTSYERTTKYKGYPAYEKMEQRGNTERFESQVVVGERFVVAIEANNATEAQIEEARESIDYDDLESRKDEGT